MKNHTIIIIIIIINFLPKSAGQVSQTLPMARLPVVPTQGSPHGWSTAHRSHRPGSWPSRSRTAWPSTAERTGRWGSSWQRGRNRSGAGGPMGGLTVLASLGGLLENPPAIVRWFLESKVGILLPRWKYQMIQMLLVIEAHTKNENTWFFNNSSYPRATVT